LLGATTPEETEAAQPELHELSKQIAALVEVMKQERATRQEELTGKAAAAPEGVKAKEEAAKAAKAAARGGAEQETAKPAGSLGAVGDQVGRVTKSLQGIGGFFKDLTDNAA